MVRLKGTKDTYSWVVVELTDLNSTSASGDGVSAEVKSIDAFGQLDGGSSI